MIKCKSGSILSPSTATRVYLQSKFLTQGLTPSLFRTQMGKAGALPYLPESFVLAIASGLKLQNSLDMKDVMLANMMIRNDDSGRGFKVRALFSEANGKLLTPII